jgi:hypothetical protein
MDILNSKNKSLNNAVEIMKNKVAETEYNIRKLQQTHDQDIEQIMLKHQEDIENLNLDIKNNQIDTYKAKQDCLANGARLGRSLEFIIPPFSVKMIRSKKELSIKLTKQFLSELNMFLSKFMGTKTSIDDKGIATNTYLYELLKELYSKNSVQEEYLKGETAMIGRVLTIIYSLYISILYNPKYKEVVESSQLCNVHIFTDENIKTNFPDLYQLVNFMSQCKLYFDKKFPNQEQIDTKVAELRYDGEDEAKIQKYLFNANNTSGTVLATTKAFYTKMGFDYSLVSTDPNALMNAVLHSLQENGFVPLELYLHLYGYGYGDEDKDEIPENKPQMVPKRPSHLNSNPSPKNNRFT